MVFKKFARKAQKIGGFMMMDALISLFVAGLAVTAMGKLVKTSSDIIQLSKTNLVMNNLVEDQLSGVRWVLLTNKMNKENLPNCWLGTNGDGDIDPIIITSLTCDVSTQSGLAGTWVLDTSVDHAILKPAGTNIDPNDLSNANDFRVYINKNKAYITGLNLNNSGYTPTRFYSAVVIDSVTPNVSVNGHVTVFFENGSRTQKQERPFTFFNY